MTKKQKYFYTYKITHIESGRFYYGQRQTVKTDDSAYMGSGTIIKGLVKKYGSDAFTKEILGYYPDADALNAAEAGLITKETLNDPLCVNLKTGGDCGRPSKETRAKMSASRKSFCADPEYRAKMSAATKAAWEDPEYRAKQSEVRDAMWKDPEYRAYRANQSSAKKSEDMKAVWADPEKKAKRAAAISAGWARRKEKIAA